MTRTYAIPLQPRKLKAGAVSSEADIEQFRQRQRQAGPQPKPLSATTSKGLEALKKRWASYCAYTQRQPTEHLVTAGYPEFTAFFKWLVENANASRASAPQGPTLRQYFRNLLMWRERVSGEELSSKERKGVNIYLDYDLAGKRPTVRRKKNVMSEVDFLKILAFHYTGDPSRYENERQRVQFAMLFLIHAFSAARPCSTTNTNTRKTRAAEPLGVREDGVAAAADTPPTWRSHADLMICCQK